MDSKRNTLIMKYRIGFSKFCLFLDFANPQHFEVFIPLFVSFLLCRFDINTVPFCFHIYISIFVSLYFFKKIALFDGGYFFFACYFLYHSSLVYFFVYVLTYFGKSCLFTSVFC